MNSKLKKYIPYFLLILSIIFIIFGSFRNEVDTVISKAIRICLECVGIG